MQHLTRWRTVTAAAATAALGFGALGIAGAMNGNGPERIELATNQVDGNTVAPVVVEPSAESVASQASAAEAGVSVAEATDVDTVAPSPTVEDFSTTSIETVESHVVNDAGQEQVAVIGEGDDDITDSLPSVPSNDSADEDVLAETQSVDSPPSVPSADSGDSADEDDLVETQVDDESDDSPFSVPSVDSGESADDDD
jgi:hypothetical protein